MSLTHVTGISTFFLLSFLFLFTMRLLADGLSAEQLLGLKSVSGAKLSPDGQ